MKIDMNKDFETEFQNSVWNGFTLKEVVTGVSALLGSIVVVVLIWYFTRIPINVCVYFGLPIMIPIVALGMIRYQGSSVWELLKEIRYTQMTRKLVYEAGEYEESKAHVFSMKSRKIESKKSNAKRGGMKRGSI